MSYDFPAHESTRKRRRWGCTCGCVMILIVAIIAGIVFFYLGLKSNKEFPRYAMMDAETDGFGVLRLSAEDEGVAEFTSFLFNRLKKAHAQEDSAGQGQAIGVLLKVSKNFLTQFLQPETMLYAQYNPATADESIVMSVPLKNRMSWLILRQYIEGNISEKPVTSHGTAQIYQLSTDITNGTGTLLSLDPNDIVISDNQAMLIKSLNYVNNSKHAATPSPRLQQFIDELALDEPPPGEDLAAAMVNEESRITNLIFVFEEFIGISGLSEQIAGALAAQRLTFADISGIKMTADLASADQLKGEFTLYCPNSDTAARLAKVLESALPKITGKRDGSPFELKGTSAGRGVTVVVSLEINGLQAWIEQLIPVAEEPAAVAPEPASAP